MIGLLLWCGLVMIIGIWVCFIVVKKMLLFVFVGVIRFDIWVLDGGLFDMVLEGLLGEGMC